LIALIINAHRKDGNRL